MSSDKPIIEIRNLKVRIAGKEVLKGINLEIPRNKVFAIMGPSGSGKSTILRSINRLWDLYPEVEIDGEILLDGKDVYAMKDKEVRRLVGMVFQRPNPFPHMSIFDNVAIGLKMNKLVKSKEELRERVEWALKKAYLWDEVKDELKKKASQLSGGQQQRLCIARALALKPKVLLMDEPTSALDVVSTKKIEETIVELKKDLTIVIVTHNPQQAARISDYVAFVYQGQVIEVGPTSEIFTRPKNKLTEKYVLGKV
ncbi:phosphate ABC transporter ATP-binding protein [Ignicoccus islandicus DSM 13165]|uniref:Phosphate ABC transporter ATP-binding protein n=1 Tax=Ignicoccus islandicus DSM 13165 TaxID=940295 RepID=A0A0U2U5T2_9CREN|nr:phosphate ABC transporter ATP-binding protein PstB [Ignicoccus islandicus]ALU11524.1 phosphate ABC transporter ATP-binding protein [Ignicoccus islandicus DSM 13165]